MTEIIGNSFDLPQDIKEFIQITLIQCQSAETLVPLIQHIYADLNQCQVFNDLVDTACHFTPSEEKPVFHQSLAETEQYRLSLIGIHSFFPIPVHDHPHAMGVQFVVHGRLQVRSYQLLEAVREPSLVRLECLSENILGAGSTSTTEKASCNLHGLQSMNITAVCLALQVPPCIEHQQAWYFPTHPLADHTQVITWNRVIKSPIKFDVHQNQSPQHELEGVGT